MTKAQKFPIDKTSIIYILNSCSFGVRRTAFETESSLRTNKNIKRPRMKSRRYRSLLRKGFMTCAVTQSHV